METYKSWQTKLFLNKLVKKRCREFQEYGYQGVDEKALWAYLHTYRWRNRKGMSFSEKKTDIQEMTFNDYFDFQQIQAQTSLPEEFNWQNLTDIMK